MPLAVATIAIAGGLLIADRQITASRDDLDRQIAASRKDLDRQISASRKDVDRQLRDSRRQVALQIAAERGGRRSDGRAGVYGGFANAVERHIDAVGSSEAAIQRADREIFVALRLVELRGSTRAFESASRIASRARRITNFSVEAAQAKRPDRTPERDFVAQQVDLARFVSRVQPELRP